MRTEFLNKRFISVIASLQLVASGKEVYASLISSDRNCISIVIIDRLDRINLYYLNPLTVITRCGFQRRMGRLAYVSLSLIRAEALLNSGIPKDFWFYRTHSARWQDTYNSLFDQWKFWNDNSMQIVQYIWQYRHIERIGWFPNQHFNSKPRRK